MVSDHNDGRTDPMVIKLTYGENFLPLTSDSVHIWKLPLLMSQSNNLSQDE
jgi:hypothetical protein